MPKSLVMRINAMIRATEKTARHLRKTTGQRFIPVPSGYWDIIRDLKALAYNQGWRTRKKQGQLCFYHPNYPAFPYRVCVDIAPPGYEIYPHYISDLKYIYEEITK